MRLASILPLFFVFSAFAAELVEVRKIWDQGAHNAFTDLIRYKGRWYCTFREAEKHVSPDGALRVLESRDGREWKAVGLVASATGDLRDPKLSITPEGRLMLTAASALRQPASARHQSMAWFSSDGKKWSEPMNIGEPNFWLWRVSWNRDTGLSAGYSTAEDRFVRLYSGREGQNFTPIVERLFERDYPNESSILFTEDGTALCLLRRDRGSSTAQLGRAAPPYREWTWKDLGVRVGGPHMIRLPDKRLIAVVRLYDNEVRTSVCQLDPEAGVLTELLPLPSGGDTSYAGLVWHQNLLWVSYYSSHEGKASIYLAKVRLE
ncbi:MAG: sialidase family protein [Bryobacteraceae bacterium]